MRTGFLVDATCDLPDRYYESAQVLVLPTRIVIGDYSVEDRRIAETALNFMDSTVARKASEAQTQAYTVEQIRTLFLEHLVQAYDFVFCLTVMKGRSQIFERATQASFGILNDYKPVRVAAGNTTPFNLRVIDTETIFAGQALPLLCGMAGAQRDEAPPQVRARIEHAIAHTHAYAVVPDLTYLSTRARAKGDKSVSPISAFIGGAFDIKPVLYCHAGDTRPVAKVRGFSAAVQKMLGEAQAAVERGNLLVPAVNLSYGGMLEKLPELPGYAELKAACQRNGVELLESVMSLTAIVNLGAGAVSVGFASTTPPALR